MTDRIPPSLVIRADADETSGAGHLMRCLALAQAWRRKGGSVSFVTACKTSSLVQMITGQGFGLVQLDAGYPDPSDLETLIPYLTEAGAAWTVVDGYHFGPDYWKAIKKTSTRLLVMDDNTPWPWVTADILLNQNLGAETLQYACTEDCRLLLGTAFTLLREEFLNADPHREFPAQARHILVTMGGADPHKTALKVIAALDQIPISQFHVDLVTGQVNPHAHEVRLALEKVGFSHRCIPGTDQIQAFMSGCDMAISAGGSTVWELSYLGIPSVYIIQADNQEPIVTAVAKEGAGINAGWHHRLKRDTLSRILGDLMADKEERMRLSANALKLINGKGADRVVSRMMEK